jgi:DNA-binding NarL/FixJ family response regulator
MEGRATEGRAIRVLLADDHALVREGMAEILTLNEDIEVVGYAADGREAVARARKEKPDVVILDVEMPVMGAQEALGHLLEISPQPKIIIVSVFADQRLVRELLGLGASGYLVKNASMLNLLDTVRSVAHGQARDNLTVSVPRAIFEGKEARKGSECNLSRRQLEILKLAAHGMSNREAAGELHLSESTIKRHLANTYKILGVGSRGEAARKAMSEGWISSQEIFWDHTQQTGES